MALVSDFTSGDVFAFEGKVSHLESRSQSLLLPITREAFAASLQDISVVC